MFPYLLQSVILLKIPGNLFFLGGIRIFTTRVGGKPPIFFREPLRQNPRKRSSLVVFFWREKGVYCDFVVFFFKSDMANRTWRVEDVEVCIP